MSQKFGTNSKKKKVNLRLFKFIYFYSNTNK